jgi:hypothetical protein
MDGGCEERGEIWGEALGEADATECPEDVMMGDDEGCRGRRGAKREEVGECKCPGRSDNKGQERIFAGVERTGSSKRC